MRPDLAAALVAGALLLAWPRRPRPRRSRGPRWRCAWRTRGSTSPAAWPSAAATEAVLWTHNDSGGDPALYAVGSDGRTLATLTLAGAEARDWEAMAAGRDDRGRPALFVGDIGDNNGVWPEVAVYRVAEPAELRDATVPAARYRLRYADGPHDAEALLVDPRSNRLYVATKEVAGGGLYRAPARLRTDQVNLLRRVARVPPVVTDGAWLPDGRGFVLRDYQGAYVYAAPGRRVGAFELPLQLQGESAHRLRRRPLGPGRLRRPRQRGLAGPPPRLGPSPRSPRPPPPPRPPPSRRPPAGRGGGRRRSWPLPSAAWRWWPWSCSGAAVLVRRARPGARPRPGRGPRSGGRAGGGGEGGGAARLSTGATARSPGTGGTGPGGSPARERAWSRTPRPGCTWPWNRGRAGWIPGPCGRWRRPRASRRRPCRGW